MKKEFKDKFEEWYNFAKNKNTSDVFENAWKYKYVIRVLNMLEPNQKNNGADIYDEQKFNICFKDLLNKYPKYNDFLVEIRKLNLCLFFRYYYEVNSNKVYYEFSDNENKK